MYAMPIQNTIAPNIAPAAPPAAAEPPDSAAAGDVDSAIAEPIALLAASIAAFPNSTIALQMIVPT